MAHTHSRVKLHQAAVQLQWMMSLMRRCACLATFMPRQPD
jgi:hypothetical protein